MNFLKIFLIAVAVVFAALATFWLIGVAFGLLRLLFWLIVVCVFVALLWKILGPKDAGEAEGDNVQNRLEKTEMTLDEYKRKLEAQLKQDSDRQS